MTKTRDEMNQGEIGYLADYIREFTQSSQADAALHLVSDFVRDNKIALDLFEQNKRLKEILLDAVLTDLSGQALQKKLEQWAAAGPIEREKEAERSQALRELHASQPLGIYRGLKERSEINYTAWGEDLDILMVLHNLIIRHPDEITTDKSSYILAPLSLDEPRFLREKLEEIIEAHPDKNLDLFVPVNSGRNHWRLACIELREGHIQTAILRDSLANDDLQKTPTYKNLEKAVGTLSSEVAVDAFAVGVQKNGYSCMDYVVQQALEEVNRQSPLGEQFDDIRQAKEPQELREAIVDRIIQQHLDMKENADLQQKIAHQHAEREQSKVLSEISYKDEDKLHQLLLQHKELQQDFDRLMAEKLSKLFVEKPEAEEKALIVEARKSAYRALLNKYGLFSSENGEGKRENSPNVAKPKL